MRSFLCFAAFALAAPIYAQDCQNGNCQRLPESFSIQQPPYTVQIQPDPIRYQRVRPQQQVAYRWIWVPERVGLFGWRTQYRAVMVRQ